MASWAKNIDRTSQINEYLADQYSSNHKDKIRHPVTNKYVIIKTPEGDRVEEVKEVIVHQFSMGDVEDPDLYAATPLWEWEKSEQGQWVMKNACDTPTWYRLADQMQFGYKYQIKAKLMGPALTEWLLRYGSER
jgi:hypothetical protein